MLRCSYIILIHNNEQNIVKLIESLKQIEGNFRKEFIFIDDGSSDDSLNVLKNAVNDIPRTTIITQKVQGSTISINKAISLVTGEYVHFVEGNEILHPDSTAILMDACLKLGTDVAVGLISNKKFSQETIKNNIDSRIISDSIDEIFNRKILSLQHIGKSGSMVHAQLLDKINKVDNSVYTHNMSLSLRCAKYSKFAFINNYISSQPIDYSNHDQKFNAYNNLKSIYNFAKDNEEIFAEKIAALLKMLSIETINKTNKIKYLIMYLISKYIKSYSLKRVLSLYKIELEKLF